MRKYDMSQFRKHCANTAEIGPSCYTKQADADYILRFWYQNKDKFLYKMMGEELILSKEVRYERSLDELCENVRRTLRAHYEFEQKFWDALRDELTKVDPLWDYYYSEGISEDGREANRFWQSLGESFDYWNLADGARIMIRRREGAPLTTVSTTICGKEITLSAGQKVMKVYGKLANMLGLGEEFEKYRIAHSQALNQKTVSGMLHLSIHPLDYATASDNNNGWDSCMSWYNEGCYRLGTIEMMNSPCVVCCYLTGKNVMENVGGGEWNSKKWRAWAIVDKDIIVLNRQYPYENENLAETVINWIAELAQTNLGWEYGEFQNDYNYADADFYLHCGYMYNDFNGEAPARVREGARGKDIYFSGPANCMWCGEEIDGDIEAGTTICNNCRETTHCTCCGDYIRDDDILWGPDELPYCFDCYNERFTECEICNEVVDKEDTVVIDFPIHASLWNKLVLSAPRDSFFRNYWTLPFDEDSVKYPSSQYIVCKNCLSDFDIDPETDILYVTEMPFPQYRYSWSKHYSVGNMLDPRKVTFEQACDVFRVSRNAEVRNAWRTIWEDYTETLYTHGIISRE